MWPGAPSHLKTALGMISYQHSEVAERSVLRLRGRLRMREVVAVTTYFYFLGPMRFATGRPVGPITAVNGSNDAYTFLIWFENLKKLYLPLFSPEKSKIINYNPRYRLALHTLAMVRRAGNGSLKLTHDPLTHLICDPRPISYDP